jgi:hypothetical protein
MTTAIDALLQSATSAKEPVRKAIRAASKATGVGFDYLMTTATRESSLNPLARSQSSSASGLFQFIDTTWLATMKEHGGEHGFAAEANAIRATGQGYAIDDPAMRERVMDLRFDPAANALMGAAYTQQNMSQLQSALGREPSAGELYIAHFLGAQGAGKFILNAQRSPDAPAADAFPQAANANPSIFYDKSGKRSLGEVYAALVVHHQSAPLQAQQFASLQPENFGFTRAALGPLYRNMFTPMRKNGISPVVNALWSQRSGDAATAIANVRKPFFPMSADTKAESAPAMPETSGNGTFAL